MQSPEPEAHDKVLDNNPDRIGIWKCWFLRRGENRSTRRKTSRSKDENQQQTQPTRRVWESNPGHIGGRPAWEVNAQPLRHPCSLLYHQQINFESLVRVFENDPIPLRRL